MIALFVLSVLGSADLVWQPRPDDSLVRLANFLREQSVDVLDAQLLVDAQEGRYNYSRVYPNPNLTLRFSNIPVGPTNPPGLRAGDQVMAYTVALDYKIEINKRGYRQEHQRWLLHAERAHLASVLRKQAVALGRVLGRVAILQMTRQAFAEIAAALRSDNPKQQVLAVLVEQETQAIAADIERALAECSTVVGLKCQTFVSDKDGAHFVDNWIASVPATDEALEKRWDIREMEAQKRAADEAKSLYGAGIIPDPTFSLGFTHDRFTIGGNQQNAFMVAMTIPISFFDRGQAQEQAAVTMGNRLTLQRQRALQAGTESLRALRSAAVLENERWQTIEKKLVPQASALWKAALEKGEEIMFAERMVADAARARGECLQSRFAVALELLESLPE